MIKVVSSADGPDVVGFYRTNTCLIDFSFLGNLRFFSVVIYAADQKDMMEHHL